MLAHQLFELGEEIERRCDAANPLRGAMRDGNWNGINGGHPAERAAYCRGAKMGGILDFVAQDVIECAT